jgi:hypothetical protein
MHTFYIKFYTNLPKKMENIDRNSFTPLQEKYGSRCAELMYVCATNF